MQLPETRSPSVTPARHWQPIVRIATGPRQSRIQGSQRQNTSYHVALLTTDCIARVPGLSTHLWWTSWHPRADVLPVAFAGSPETLCLLDTTGDIVMRFLGHTRGINCAAWSPDGTTLFTASHDATILGWNGGGEVIQRFDDFPESVESVDVAPSGAWLAATTRDGVLWRLERSSRALAKTHTFDCAISRAAISPDGAHIAIASEDTRAWICDEHGAVVAELEHPLGPVYSVAWNAAGNVATTCDDGIVRVFSRDGKLRDQAPADSRRVLQVAFSPRGEFLAAGYGAGFAKIWDQALQSGVTLESAKEVTLLAWSQTSNLLAVGSGRGDLALFQFDVNI